MILALLGKDEGMIEYVKDRPGMTKILLWILQS